MSAESSRELMALAYTLLDDLQGALSKPTGSHLHQMLNSLQPQYASDWADCQVILVDYDVAGLFRETAGPSDDEGEAPPLPFEKVAFELVIDGYPTIILRSENINGHDVMEIGRRGARGWELKTLVNKNGAWAHIFGSEAEKADFLSFIEERAAAEAWMRLSHEIVVATCDALSGDILQLGPQTVPSAKLNRRRTARGSVPLFAFHHLIVPKKARDQASRAGNKDTAGVRQHLRRGHYHRFHRREGMVKHWLPAMWVGNPELGLIEKHYRLRRPSQTQGKP